jgi:hypothetical protein
LLLVLVLLMVLLMVFLLVLMLMLVEALVVHWISMHDTISMDTVHVQSA